MPHKSQKKVHNINSDINVETMNNLLKRARPKDPDYETTSELDTSTLNSSMHSEASDFDQQDCLDDDLEEESVNRDLADFMKFKIVSKDKTLVILAHDSNFYFKGKLQVKVLKGKLDVLGHSFGPSGKFISVYSPRGYSLLDVHGYRGDMDEDIADKLLAEGIAFDESKLLTGDCIFVAKKLTEDWSKFLQRNLNVKTKINLLHRDINIPEEFQNNEEIVKVEKVLDVNLMHPANNYSRLFKTGENWDLALTSVEIAQKNDLAPKIVVAGGKGVGKSTFLRWLTNKLLAKSPVVFLDLDPGQAELTVPGYLSVGLVEEPILGPNFAHVDRPTELSVYLGDINVANCPDRFIKITKRLIDFVRGEDRFKNLPMVVNTMGWCRGVGLMLIVDTIRYLQPTTLVQLHSRFHRKNYPYSLDHQTVATSKDTWDSTFKPHSLSYSLLEFLAVPESVSAKDMRSKDYWGLPDPRTTREAVILSYLGRTGWPSPVFKIPLSSLTLGVLHSKVDPSCVLAVLNLSLVDLCFVDAKHVRKPVNGSLYSVVEATKIIMPSLGLGLVRNIDMADGVLYLVTSIPTRVLDKVNCLLVGTTKLPDSILLSNKQKGSPYLSTSSSNPLDCAWQRHHKPRGQQ